MPTLHRFALFGASADPEIAGDIADDPDDYFSDGDGSRKLPVPGGGSSNRSFGSMEFTEALNTGARSIVAAASFDEWVALEPFRQTTTENDGNESNADESISEGTSLLGPLFANLPRGSAGSTGRSDFAVGGGAGFEGVAGSGYRSDTGASSVIARRARRLIDQPTHGSTAVNATNSGGSNDAGNLTVGDSSAGGGNSSGATGNGGGTTAGGSGNGNGSGVGFVPDGDLTGNPADTNVSIIVTDPVLTDAGDPGGGILPNQNAPDVPAVPEPTGLVLLGSGLVLAAHSLRSRFRNSL